MAQATLTHLFNPAAIDALFARVAQRQYTHQLLFSSLVDLMGQVVLRQQPSVHAAYRQAEAVLPVSDQADYNKLQCVERAVSAALVHDAAQRVAPVLDALDARLPALLPGYHVRILDGNHLAATEHRLKELRFSWAAPLPGTVLAVLDQERMTVTDVIPLEDAHAQERSVLDQVLAVVRPKDVWVADRNFCTLNFLLGILHRGGFFVIRQHGQLTGCPE
jgi:hypothetical protein